LNAGSLLSCKYLPVALAMVLLAPGAAAQEETLYMAVLNSRQHHWGNMQNPLVGTFVSSDLGQSWKHLGWKEYIRTFYVEAGPDGTLWAACGNGVLRSRDGGARWTITTGWEITEVLKLDVDSADPSRVFAATAYGVFRSTSGGDAWTHLDEGFQTRFTCDVVIDPEHPQVVFVATEEGLYRSVDGGNRWSLAGLDGQGIRCILHHPFRQEWWYLGTEDRGVWRSTDGGTTWEPSSDGLDHPTVYCLLADPSSEVMMAGTHGGGVYRSEDGGTTWIQSSQGLTFPDVHCLVDIPSEPARVFAGTLGGGLFVSIDGGRSWRFNSQEEAQVYGLSVAPARLLRRQE